MDSIRAKLEEKIQGRHLLAHSFYTRWQAGELSKEELRGYAKEYYAFEKEFPRFISRLHSKCENQKMRQELLENLIHEERGETNHIDLWLQFAEGLGLTREEVQSHFRSDETEHLLRVLRKNMETEGMVAGLASLYAYERQQPDVARQKTEGLQKFYGVNDERTTAFFQAHQTYDVYHAETEAALLTALCQDEATRETAVKAAEETLNALYDFLDGVERRYGNGKKCTVSPAPTSPFTSTVH